MGGSSGERVKDLWVKAKLTGEMIREIYRGLTCPRLGVLGTSVGCGRKNETGEKRSPFPADHTPCLPTGYCCHFSSKDSSMIRASSSSSLMRSFLCSSCSRWDSSSANVSWSFSDILRQGIEMTGCRCWSSSSSIRSQDSDDGDDEEEGKLLMQLVSLRLSSRALNQQ